MFLIAARGHQSTCPCNQHMKDVKAGAELSHLCNYSITKQEERIKRKGRISVNSLAKGVQLLCLSFLEI